MARISGGDCLRLLVWMERRNLWRGKERVGKGVGEVPCGG